MKGGRGEILLPTVSFSSFNSEPIPSRQLNSLASHDLRDRCLLSLGTENGFSGFSRKTRLSVRRRRKPIPFHQSRREINLTDGRMGRQNEQWPNPILSAPRIDTKLQRCSSTLSHVLVGFFVRVVGPAWAVGSYRTYRPTSQGNFQKNVQQNITKRTV